ncbi:MAG: 30S ribosomal protein S17 [Treponema sp.]|nr:30S ribosomal protein S17 [Treponema sp.]
MAGQEIQEVKEVEPSIGARKKSSKKEFVGTVKSDKMTKTIVVAIETMKLHPLYKKYVKRLKKVKAHDENNDAKIGDRVRVIECRPLSREKHWRLVEILERAK